MAQPTRQSSDRIRFRYGMCLNDSCEKCKSKEVQEIAARKDFVCAECGKPLRECPPPRKRKTTGPVGLVIALAVLVIAALLAWLFWPESTPKPEPKPEPVGVVDPKPVVKPDTEPAVDIDTVDTVVEPEPEKNPEPAPVLNGHGTVTLSYGRYTGDLKNGKPHGYGKVTYTKTQRLTGSKEFVAEPGDTYEGEFRNGVPSGGRGYFTHNGDVQTINL